MILYASREGLYHRMRLLRNGTTGHCPTLKRVEVHRRVTPLRFAGLIRAGLVCRLCCRGA